MIQLRLCCPPLFTTQYLLLVFSPVNKIWALSCPTCLRSIRIFYSLMMHLFSMHLIVPGKSSTFQSFNCAEVFLFNHVRLVIHSKYPHIHCYWLEYILLIFLLRSLKIPISKPAAPEIVCFSNINAISNDIRSPLWKYKTQNAALMWLWHLRQPNHHKGQQERTKNMRKKTQNMTARQIQKQ